MNISSDIGGIDLELIEKKSISGKVILPEGTAPKGGIKIEVYAEDAGDTWVTIPEGQSYAEYTMKVLPSLQGSGYKVKYVVFVGLWPCRIRLLQQKRYGQKQQAG